MVLRIMPGNGEGLLLPMREIERVRVAANANGAEKISASVVPAVATAMVCHADTKSSFRNSASRAGG